MLKQWREIKARHPDAILFFRMGDFYEMFFDDAQLGARVLNITLTARGDGVPLAGVPVKAAADYLRQLDRRGPPRRHLRAGRGPEARQGHRAARSDRDGHARRAARRTAGSPGARNNWIVAVAAGSADGGGSPARRDRPRPPASSCSRRWTRPRWPRRSGGSAPAEVVRPVRRRAPACGWTTLRCAPRASAWEFDADLAREELARRFSARLARRTRPRPGRRRRARRRRRPAPLPRRAAARRPAASRAARRAPQPTRTSGSTR